MATLASLLVCQVIIALFVGELVTWDLAHIVSGLFIATMVATSASMIFFMGEINIGRTHTPCRLQVP